MLIIINIVRSYAYPADNVSLISFICIVNTQL